MRSTSSRVAAPGLEAGSAKICSEPRRPVRGTHPAAKLLEWQRTAGNGAVLRSLRQIGPTAAGVGDDRGLPGRESRSSAPAQSVVRPPGGEELPIEESAEGTPSRARATQEGDAPSRGSPPVARGGADVRDLGRVGSPEALWSAGGTEAVAGQAPISWGQMQTAGVPGAPAIPGPSVAPLDKIQKADGFNPSRIGWTSFPIGSFKAPDFDFNSVNKGAAKGAKAGKGPKGGKAPPAAWYSTPKLTRKAYEGDSVCWFLAAGTHKTTHVEGGKPVFWTLPAAMSARDAAAEGEHSQDIKRAYKLSLSEAERVLSRHVVGVTFGPKPTKVAAEKLVLDTIKAKLAYPKLGSDKTKWGAKYDTLYRLTAQRDTKGWHSFGLGARKTDKAGNVFYTINKGTTNVGSVPSAKIINY